MSTVNCAFIKLPEIKATPHVRYSGHFGSLYGKIYFIGLAPGFVFIKSRFPGICFAFYFQFATEIKLCDYNIINHDFKSFLSRNTFMEMTVNFAFLQYSKRPSFD